MKLIGKRIGSYRLTKDGKLVKVTKYRDVSHRIAASKSNTQRVARGMRP